MIPVAHPLGPTSWAVLAFLWRYHDERGYAPTVREVGDELGGMSTSNVAHHLRRLDEWGFIRHTAGISRGIAMLRRKGE